MARSPRDSFGKFKTRDAPYLQAGSDTFGLAERREIERSFLATARRLRTQLLRFVDDRATGSLSIQGFVARSRAAIRTSYFTAYSLGAISIFPFYTLTDRDVRILDEELDSETGFLRDFATDFGGASLHLEPISRAGLYLLALRGIFEKGRIEAAPPGPYLWNLGATEHCLPCLTASVSGPYQRDRTSGLGLEPLPGSPGDGSVCRGLTRCGCTIKLATGIALPNEDLPDLIREMLLEVVYGSSPPTSGTEVE